MNVSLIPPAMSKTIPITSGAIVFASDPSNTRSLTLSATPRRSYFALTCCLTKIKAKEQADDASNETNESDKIKFGKFVPDRAFLMGVKIEESEEKSCCNTASRPADDCQYER